MHACRNNCWFSANKTYCSPCDRKNKEQTVIDALTGNSVEALVKVLNDTNYTELIQKGDTLDNILRKMYILDKKYLEVYLNDIQGTPSESYLISRIHTHSNTFLCTVVGWMIRNGLYDSSINICCLRCMYHLIRYGESDDIKYSIQFGLTGPHHINVNSAIIKNKNNLPLLTDIGNAIIETKDKNHIFHQYNQLVRNNISEGNYILYLEELNNHPLLHMATLESDIDFQIKILYTNLMKRKEPYWEELMAKGMHPSRVMQWCMTEDQKKCFDKIPEYIFSSEEAPWNTSSC